MVAVRDFHSYVDTGRSQIRVVMVLVVHRLMGVRAMVMMVRVAEDQRANHVDRETDRRMP